ncbi:plasmid partitioning protein RepB [Ciceribacter sp. L1K22]|uniref:plasmid partitioning protein RepB n=1 Tax=Ciceribacter sp. L1K22 TaxID=2820275 RepID=UPI001ABE5E38|nr:plasmid partitioning protein RepB [Ciceribacter sp. L1K22]
MARKDVFANITAPQGTSPERRATPGYATRGASRSMISSLNELAEKAALAEQNLVGEAVVELDTAVVENSFVSDRMGDDAAAYSDLLEAIRERGQDSPILVRPHPQKEGHYQIVFGHRRARAARDLGRPVRAVVKSVTDADHVIAQGQENSARENLSFIERATFAQKLLELGHDKKTIQSALSVDAPMLTRMLFVTGRVPAPIVAAIGPAKSVGRDRWIEFAQQVERPPVLSLVSDVVAGNAFKALESDGRFDLLTAELKRAARPARKPKAAAEWQSEDASVRAEFKGSGRAYSITLKSTDAARFGRFISENLERLHKEFVNASKAEGK